METQSHIPPDPIVLVRQLDPDAIRRHLTDMEAERQALLILLRAALAARRNRKAARS